MRCLVTGAAGFIGSHLCQRLVADGCEVVGVDNLITGRLQNLHELQEQESFVFLQQDICTPLAVEGPVDVLFNFACPASPIDFQSKAVAILQVCSAGVRHVLELARSKSATFVQASTSECYGDPREHPQPESYWGNVNPIGERSAYDEGKRFAEALTMAYHRAYGMPTRIGRIFNTYGPRMRPDDGRVLPNFIRQALENKPLTVYGDGRQTRSFCYVSDLVDAFLRLSRCEDVLPVNIGNTDEITILQLAGEVIERAGSRSAVVTRPAPADDPRLRCPDISRARRLLDWQPTTPRAAGLDRTIAYFRTVVG